MPDFNLRRRSYAFWLLSRFYWLVNGLFVVTVITVNAVAAVLTTQPDIKVYQQPLLALSIVSAVLTAVKNVSGFAENSAICRDISRSLDTLANDYAKGRLSDAQTEKKILTIRRRVPLGTCFFLRLSRPS